MRLASEISGLRRRLSVMWAEAEYGRKRMLEVRTGHVYTDETRRRLAAREIEHLNALFTDSAVSSPPMENESH